MRIRKLTGAHPDPGDEPCKGVGRRPLASELRRPRGLSDLVDFGTAALVDVGGLGMRWRSRRSPSSSRVPELAAADAAAFAPVELEDLGLVERRRARWSLSSTGSAAAAIAGAELT